MFHYQIDVLFADTEMTAGPQIAHDMLILVIFPGVQMCFA